MPPPAAARYAEAMRLLVMLPLALLLRAQSGPANAGFEQGAVGQPPAGWLVPAASTFRAAITDRNCKTGKQCAIMERDRSGGPQDFGNLMQMLDAAPYRGKTVRLRAAVRTELARAQMWLRIDRPNQAMGFFDNMNDRPIVLSEWRDYEITGDVADDAQAIALGVMAFGEGRVFVDDVSLTVVAGAVTEPAEPPRPLTARGLDNEIAFARLLGYVRHFHPSDQAAKTDWSDFAIRGVRAVEDSADAAALARKLESLFAPVAPTVRVFVTGQAPALPAELRLPPAGGFKVIRWNHYGFGDGAIKSAYHSERVPDCSADPAKPFAADLGGGVSCLVPLALYTGSAGTLPHREMPPPTAPPRRTAADRATRLAGVMLAWNVLEHFYPYFDVVRTGWPAELTEGLASAATAADTRAYYETLSRLAAALHDGHAHVNGDDGKPAARARLPLAWDWIEGRLVVTQVAEAAGAHVVRGDVVLSIGGKPTGDVLRDTEALISGATPQWIRARALTELAICERGSIVTLGIAPGGDASRMQRFGVPCNSEGLTEKRPGSITELEKRIWYIDLNVVTDQDFTAAVFKLAEARGLIFDLRGYPRMSPVFLQHLSATPLDSAQWHIPLVQRPDHQDLTFARTAGWNLQPVKPLFTANRVFLTGGGAISYAESCMGIVEAYKLADIVGGTTAGTNGNVNTILLPGGYSISFTGMKVLKHDGSQHHGVGIRPTVPVERTRQGVAAGRDEVLERGLALVRSRM